VGAREGKAESSTGAEEERWEAAHGDFVSALNELIQNGRDWDPFIACSIHIVPRVNAWQQTTIGYLAIVVV